MELNLQQTKTQKKEKNNWEETLKKKTKQTKKDNIVRVYQKPKKKKQSPSTNHNYNFFVYFYLQILTN